MGQPVECSNHQDKNAVRLCDDCGKPFCAECLRKNVMGFYYCQHCYPALFKNTFAPAYGIPRGDEEGLRRLQKQMNVMRKKIPPRWGSAIIGIIVGLVSPYFIAFIQFIPLDVILLTVFAILFIAVIYRHRFGYIPCWKDGSSLFRTIAGTFIGETIGMLVGIFVFDLLFGWGHEGAPLMFGAFWGYIIGGIVGGIYFSARR